MKKELAKKDESLKKATEEVNELLKVLTKEGDKAEVKQKEVSIIADNCQKQKEQIQAEKEVADRELAGALPYLHSALKAAEGIS